MLNNLSGEHMVMNSGLSKHQAPPTLGHLPSPESPDCFQLSLDAYKQLRARHTEVLRGIKVGGSAQ